MSEEEGCRKQRGERFGGAMAPGDDLTRAATATRLTATQAVIQLEELAHRLVLQQQANWVLREELKAERALARNGRHMIEENKRLDKMLESALDRNTELEEKFCNSLSSIRRAIYELEEKVQKIQVHWDDKDGEA